MIRPRKTIFLMHKTRSRRANIACSNCRKRKIKCVTNREPPHRCCDRCSKRGLKCEYIAVINDPTSPPPRSAASTPGPRDSESTYGSSPSLNGSSLSLPLDPHGSGVDSIDRQGQVPPQPPAFFHHEFSIHSNHDDAYSDRSNSPPYGSQSNVPLSSKTGVDFGFEYLNPPLSKFDGLNGYYDNQLSAPSIYPSVDTHFAPFNPIGFTDLEYSGVGFTPEFSGHHALPDMTGYPGDSWNAAMPSYYHPNSSNTRDSNSFSWFGADLNGMS